ncbi:hypothetical protein NCCP2495_05880 [Dietzia sp. NCCP-2495]|uniref:hypothetical protein n=1 Tax=Dietzia sp. NCCP-2495 TaxID=2934675 RepID=UPI00222FED04|nr:hypothetical protein [Dietzia sp. NCCP-2495]GLB62710.1 hypothetical protein NCCP2495_05880 [Dietzia sp. NCCP-2495]
MQPRHQLAALIQSVEDANGWSDPEVAERARQRGHTISKSNISRLRLEPVRSIKGDAIKALAAGLGISPLDIADAALASMGIHRSNAADNDVETAIRRDPLLADSQRRMLLALLREMKGTHDEDQGTQDPPSNPPADGEARADGAPMKGADIAWLDDRRAPDVDDMLDRVTEEARRQDEAEQELEEPLPYEPEQLHAARDLPGMSEGERRRLPGKDAGEENQEPDDWEGA